MPEQVKAEIGTGRFPNIYKQEHVVESRGAKAVVSMGMWRWLIV